MTTIPLAEPLTNMGEAIALHTIPGRQIVCAVPIHDDGAFHEVHIAIREGHGPFATYSSFAIEADGGVRYYADHRYDSEAAISRCFEGTGWGPVIVNYQGQLPLCHNNDDECFGEIFNGYCHRHRDD